jgi:hypothetical protein
MTRIETTKFEARNPKQNSNDEKLKIQNQHGSDSAFANFPSFEFVWLLYSFGFGASDLGFASCRMKDADY